MITYFTFYRESNDFSDILKDQILKKITHMKIKWVNYLMIGIHTKDDGNKSYITLKYGDSIITDITKDYSPVPNVDYTPVRK